MKKGQEKVSPVISDKAKGIHNSLKKPAVSPDLQMFSDTQDWLRRETDRMANVPRGRHWRARARELDLRNQQLLRDVTRWMEREAAK
jgi:hypothetical protein